jgi:hypothetical protein
MRLDMLGMVKARSALDSSRMTGIKKVELQCLSMTRPMTSEPTVLPSLPKDIERLTAIALEAQKSQTSCSSEVEMFRPHVGREKFYSRSVDYADAKSCQDHRDVNVRSSFRNPHKHQKQS